MDFVEIRIYEVDTRDESMLNSNGCLKQIGDVRQNVGVCRQLGIKHILGENENNSLGQNIKILNLFFFRSKETGKGSVILNSSDCIFY